MTQHPIKPALLDLLRRAQTSQNDFFKRVPEAERAESGTSNHWSAKDHVAHLTFWRQRLALRLRAIARHEPQPGALNFEEQNPRIYAEQAPRPWSTILTESDQAYADLIALTTQLTEEDLTAWGRFEWMEGGEPLYIAYLGNCYEHAQIHLAQYLLDRHEPARAQETYEVWVRRVLDADLPGPLKGTVLYNLACYYATHDVLDVARRTLGQSLTLYPDLRAFALTDPELEGARPDSAQEPTGGER